MFYQLFTDFVDLFQRSNFNESYLEGEPPKVIDADKAFLNNCKDNIQSWQKTD